MAQLGARTQLGDRDGIRARFPGSSFAPYSKTFFGFYIGAQDPYPGFVQDNERLDKELTEAAIPHVFELYQGAHDPTFWREHQDEWLGAAVDRLDPPS